MQAPAAEARRAGVRPMSESLGEALLYLRTDDRGLEAGIAAAKGKSEGLGRTFDDPSGKAGTLGKAMDLAGGSATRLAMQQGQLTTVAKVQGAERKGVVEGKSESVRVRQGGRRTHNKKTTNKKRT